MPDGKRVVVPVAPEVPPLREEDAKLPADSDRRDTEAEGVHVYRAEPPDPLKPDSPNSYPRTEAWNLEKLRMDLAIINVGTGEVRRIARNVFLWQFRVSGNGTAIAYATTRRFQNDNSQGLLFDLVLCSVQNDQCTTVVTNSALSRGGTLFNPSFDGTSLAYIAGERLYVVDSRGTAKQEYAAPAPQHFNPLLYCSPKGSSLYFAFAHALWRTDIDRGQMSSVAEFHGEVNPQVVGGYDRGQVASLDRGKRILLRTSNTDTRKEGLVSVDLASGVIRMLWEQDQAITVDFMASADGGTIVYEAEQTAHPNEVWTSVTDGAPPRQLTNLNPDFDRYALGTGRIVTWTTLEGKETRGPLILPADYKSGRRYPLVVCIYGVHDDYTIELNYFGLMCGHGLSQLLASRGIAVLTSGGFPEIGKPIDRAIGSVLPAIDSLAAAGVIDPNRVGVVGLSNGGYDVPSLIVQSQRLKAAVMEAGTADLLGEYSFLALDGSSFGLSIVEGELGVTPWENPQRYIENSPYYYLDRVQTPLLIIHGENDPNVPAFLSDELFVGLRRLGKKAEYVKYEHEGHAPQEWSYAHRLDYYKRVIDWFERYLRPRE